MGLLLYMPIGLHRTLTYMYFTDLRAHVLFIARRVINSIPVAPDRDIVVGVKNIFSVGLVF